MDVNTISLHIPNGLNMNKTRIQLLHLPLVGSVSIDKAKGSASRCGSRRISYTLLISMGFQMKYTSSTGKPPTDGNLFNKPWKMNRMALIGAALPQQSILRDAAAGEPQ